MFSYVTWYIVYYLNSIIGIEFVVEEQRTLLYFNFSRTEGGKKEKKGENILSNRIIKTKNNNEKKRGRCGDMKDVLSLLFCCFTYLCSWITKNTELCKMAKLTKMEEMGIST
jgi:hypothetical protein